MPAHVQISLLRRMPCLPGGAVMTLSAILLTTSKLTSPFTWAGMRTRIAQVVEHRARYPEVRGSNPGSGLKIFLLRSYNVNFPRQKLWVCFQLIIWFEYHIHVKCKVSSLVVNKMADSAMTAPPGKSGIRLKREIWTWVGMKTRIAQVVERRARNPEVLVQIFLLKS